MFVARKALAPPCARTDAAPTVVVVVAAAATASAFLATNTVRPLLVAMLTPPRLPLLLREEQLPGVARMGCLLFFSVGILRNLKPSGELLDRHVVEIAEHLERDHYLL